MTPKLSYMPTLLLILAAIFVFSPLPGWPAVICVVAAGLFALRDGAEWGGGWDRDDDDQHWTRQ